MDGEHFRRWAAAIADRGPDGFGIWTSDGAALANAFLRLYPGWPEVEQPCTLDGSVWISADARIDGIPELRRELAAAGHTTQPIVSDAELILHAYAAWGLGCSEHLLGDFAFVIWDEPHRRLFAARDRFGTRPLYYATTPGPLLVSNHANALFMHPAVDRSPDERTIAGFLLHNELGAPEATAFAGIRRVPGAHQLVYQNGSVRITRYWSVPVEEPLICRDPREYPARFWELVSGAVSDAARGAPVGVLLSGGLDSPMLAAALQHNEATRGLGVAYTCVWRELMPDLERPYAESIRDWLAMPGELHDYDAYHPFERSAQVQLASPLPDGSPFSIDTHDLFARLSGHARVAFTGLGPDAFLRGEPLLPLLWRGPHRIRAATGATAYARSHRKRPPLGIRPWLARRRSDGPPPEWLPQRFVELAAAAESPSAGAEHRFRPAAYRLTASSYWQTYLEWYQGSAYNAIVQCTHPFFDTRVVSFALSLPAVPWSWDKHVMRSSLAGYLPPHVVNRRKAPLGRDRLLAYAKRHGTGWFGELTPSDHVAPYYLGAGFASLGDAYVNRPDWIHVRPICLDLFLQAWNAQPTIA